MNESYAISRYRPEHKPQVAELQKDLWSSDTRLNTAYLEWKYEQNPYLDSSHLSGLASGGSWE